MRLIDCEPLIEFCEEVVSVDWNHKVAPVSWAYAEQEFMDRLKEAPTADAVEVKHGRWHDIYQIDKFHYIRVCSVCNKRNVFHQYDGGGNYCPNCGARMDGE